MSLEGERNGKQALADGPDSTRSWVVQAFCAWYGLFSWSIIGASPVLYVGLMRDLDVNRKDASLPFSVMMAAVFLGSILYAILSKKLNEKWLLTFGAALCSFPVIAAYWANNLVALVILLGVLHGTGIACTTVVPLAILAQYFDKKRSTAMGLYTVAIGFTGIVFPPISEIFLNEYGFSRAILLIGGLTLNLFASCLLITGAPWKNTDHLRSDVKSRTCHTVKSYCTKSFTLVCSSNALTDFVGFTFSLIVVDFAVDCGLVKYQAVTTTTAFSTGSILAGIVTGYVIDRFLLHKGLVILVSFAFQGVAIVLLTFFKHFVVFHILSLAVGVGHGSRIFLFGVVLSDEYEHEKLPMAYALTSVVTSIPFFCRTPIIGYARDVIGKYDGLLQCLAGINIVLASCWAWDYFSKRKVRVIQQ